MAKQSLSTPEAAPEAAPASPVAGLMPVPELVLAAAGAQNQPPVPPGLGKQTRPHAQSLGSQLIGRPGQTVSPLVAQAQAAEAAVPAFAAGVSAEQRALREACAKLTGGLATLISHGTKDIVTGLQLLAAVQSLPGAAEEAAREGLDLVKAQGFLAELRAVYLKFDVEPK